MTEPPFPRFRNVDHGEPPRKIAYLSRLTFGMLVDIGLILIGLFVLVTPGHPTWLYALWLLVVAAGAADLNLGVRLTMREARL